VIPARQQNKNISIANVDLILVVKQRIEALEKIARITISAGAGKAKWQRIMHINAFTGNHNAANSLKGFETLSPSLVAQFLSS
jgi:hypothetical protein